MATKPAAHRPTLKNPGSPHVKKTAAKKPAAKKNPAAVGRPANKKRVIRRTNPTGGTNLLLFAVGGAVAVKGFDLLCKYLIPTIAAPVTIIAMGAAAFALSHFGGKYLGKWADIGAVGLGAFAVARAIQEWVDPQLPSYLQTGGGNVQITATQPLVSSSDPSQVVGTRLHLVGGGIADVINDSSQGDMGMAYGMAA